ncbi:hypothetical protein ACJX0J_036075 [Zea mays]
MLKFSLDTRAQTSKAKSNLTESKGKFITKLTLYHTLRTSRGFKKSKHKGYDLWYFVCFENIFTNDLWDEYPVMIYYHKCYATSTAGNHGRWLSWVALNSENVFHFHIFTCMESHT